MMTHRVVFLPVYAADLWCLAPADLGADPVMLHDFAVWMWWGCDA